MEVIEIKGVKFEVDTAKMVRIHEFRIGDPVKVLVKKYSDYEACPGIVISIDMFKLLPSVTVAYISKRYSNSDIEYATYNQDSKEMEICPLNPEDSVAVCKGQIVESLDKQIEGKRQEISVLELKKKHFLERFGAFFKGQE